MTKLPDLGAVYVDISNMEKPLVKFIISDEQCQENQHQLSDCAESITEEIQEFMEWEERLLKENMELLKKIY
jgi:hypothetical protein